LADPAAASLPSIAESGSARVWFPVHLVPGGGQRGRKQRRIEDVKHLFIHRLRSGNVASISVALPLPERGTVTFHKPPSAADWDEMPAWRQRVALGFQALDGLIHDIRIANPEK
jgi:hypothetical protein